MFWRHQNVLYNNTPFPRLIIPSLTSFWVAKYVLKIFIKSSLRYHLGINYRHKRNVVMVKGDGNEVKLEIRIISEKAFCCFILIVGLNLKLSYIFFVSYQYFFQGFFCILHYIYFAFIYSLKIYSYNCAVFFEFKDKCIRLIIRNSQPYIIITFVVMLVWFSVKRDCKTAKL